MCDSFAGQALSFLARNPPSPGGQKSNLASSFHLGGTRSQKARIPKVGKESQSPSAFWFLIAILNFKMVALAN